MNTIDVIAGFQNPTEKLEIPRLFISYERSDEEVATKLAHDLKKNGIDIWFAQQEMIPGVVIINAINEGIVWCDKLILLWSQNAITSRWVNLEYTSAINAEKGIIPCILDNSELSPILGRYYWIDFKDYGTAFKVLIQSFRN